MIRVTGSGIFREVAAPVLGHQDTGLAPGGAQDRFSWETARILLGDSAEIRTWELVLPPRMMLLEDCIGVLTGGEVKDCVVGDRPVPHGKVFQARKGELLRWGIRARGYRTLLALCPRTDENAQRIGLERGAFTEVAHWMHPEEHLRVLPGPEMQGLEHPEAFLAAPWVSSITSSDAGIRLQGGSTEAYADTRDQLVSVPVADGTLQLTPDGMILLLRSRSTHGGYPRVFTLYDVDIDLAAQLPPRRRFRFTMGTPEEALRCRQVREEDFARLRARVAEKRKK